jgi:hypothetical protein
MAKVTAPETSAPACAGGAVTSAYTFTLTAGQIFSFADLVRRIAQAYGPDAGRHLHQDYVNALFAFVGLTPEPSDEDGTAYCRALDLGLVPKWGMDDQPLTCTTAEWVAQSRACRHDGPAAWPGLAPAGAATYEMTLTAAQIFDFAGLVGRLGIQVFPQDGDVRLRHDLWEALQAFADLLPEPSDDNLDLYIAELHAGELTNWSADGRPLTETTAEWAARVRAQLAAEVSEDADRMPDSGGTC